MLLSAPCMPGTSLENNDSKACCRRVSIVQTCSVQMSIFASLCVSRLGNTVVISDHGESDRMTHHDQASTNLCCLDLHQLWPNLKSSVVSNGVLCLQKVQEASVSLCTILLAGWSGSSHKFHSCYLTTLGSHPRLINFKLFEQLVVHTGAEEQYRDVQ